MILAIDTENTFWNTGSPFDSRNFNVCISVAFRQNAKLETQVFFPEQRAEFAQLFERSTVLVFFNAKYDIHWLKKLGFEVGNRRIYDCQVAEYIRTRQKRPYPSLDDCAEEHLGRRKLKVIEEEYWSKGVNTHIIPRHILREYAAIDAELTYLLYEFYLEALPDYSQKLLRLRMEDLKGLAEMEWNGLKFDRDLIENRAAAAEQEIKEIKEKLDMLHNIPNFKWTSNDHLSALLYGGRIVEQVRIPIGVFKTGKKVGEPRYKVEEREYILPRRYNPIKGSELKKQGMYSVSEEYLVQLKGGGDLIKGILRIKELEKMNSTYLQGTLKSYESLNGTDDLVHGQFNACVTVTTRLSSSNPNQQNIAGNIKDIFRSRYNGDTQRLGT